MLWINQKVKKDTWEDKEDTKDIYPHLFTLNMGNIEVNNPNR